MFMMSPRTCSGVDFFYIKTKENEDMGGKGSRIANIIAWEYEKKKKYEEKRKKQKEKEQEEQKRKESK